MDRPFWALLFLISCAYSAALADDPTSESKGWGGVSPAPSENECRSFIEAALKEQRTQGDGAPDIEDQTGDGGTISEAEQTDTANQVIEETTDEALTEGREKREATDAVEGERNESTEASAEEAPGTPTEAESEEGGAASAEAGSAETGESKEVETQEDVTSTEEVEQGEPSEDKSDVSVETESEIKTEGASVEEDKSVEVGSEGSGAESAETESVVEAVSEGESKEEEIASAEQSGEADASVEAVEGTSTEQEGEHSEEAQNEQAIEQEQGSTESGEAEENTASAEAEGNDSQQSTENVEGEEQQSEEAKSDTAENKESAEEGASVEEGVSAEEQVDDSAKQSEEQQSEEQHAESTQTEGAEETSGESQENQGEIPASEESSPQVPEATEESKETDSTEQHSAEESQAQTTPETNAPESVETTSVESSTEVKEQTAAPVNDEPSTPTQTATESEPAVEEERESPEQEDLTLNIEIPEHLRPREHISEVLRLDSGSIDVEAKLLRAEETTLKDLKRLYEAAIKPLEILYKYRDLSNRHFGDPEIFSKPLILFMGPWSGGKSTIINYLLDNEYRATALRTGAEPSPAYFNIVMRGDREEILDGTQLAADWTFSGLQKFGQGLLDRLRGLKLNSPLLDKVNIVEIPGILEIRKQVERLFPLNDACQWFIDRADIIFLVYDPSKLDVGPETEAILDQLKGREYQTKIILNKADQVKPEELMRVQGTLIWNISPLMSSTEPPVMYSTSLWSHPYQSGSPSRLLFAQEKSFLKDLREAVDKRVENKISSARRFAVRVRNHAKMVDCYLTTYYNHKTFFGNKQTVSNDIIEHPQNYHIYEGLSTLTNISRYDLPDPDVYKDFFRLNPVYDFQQLASTCTYFRGCPINRLDVAIAYDLPELVGKYKKIAEDIMKTSKSQGKK